MKHIFLSAMLMAGMLVLISSCAHVHGEGTHTHGDDPHVHAPTKLEPLSFTIWTKKSELFVEFLPLVVGKESRFAAHFSEMVKFRAIEEGNVMVRLRKGTQNVEQNSVPAPSSPGIFRPAIAPQKEGTYHLDFLLTTLLFSDTITISDITVYPNEEAAIAANPPQPEGDEISFLKEQAWKIDFAIEQVERKSIHKVIHASGEILPVKGDETMLSTNTSGLVFFKSKNLMEGREIQSGEVLFTVSSKGLTEENLEEKYRIAQARLGKAKADFERSKLLLEQNAIARKVFEERQMELDIADAAFQTLADNFKSGGTVYTAPFSGIIKKLPVSDGEFVEEGEALVTLTRNRKLLIQGEVSQRYFSQLKNVRSAHFKTPWQSEVSRIEDFNGKLISYGKLTGENEHHIPVLFEVDNRGDLLAGSYVELYLLTRPVQNVLVIPKSALMQDYGQFYVYVQTGGESFERRQIQLGIDDGKQVQVLSGIEEGEWLVTTGAYQIKMAAMSSTIPAHGHSH